MIHVTVWNENVHEKSNPKVREIYPEGLHGAIASALREDPARRFDVRTATLDMPAQGLPPEVLDGTDVLIWWGHVAHAQVEDALVERIASACATGWG